MHKNNNLIAGILWFCLSGFLSVAININMKYLSQILGYHPFQLVFCYSLLGATIYAPLLVKGNLTLRTAKPALYNCRALLEIGGFSCVFFSLAHIPFAVLVSITFATPIIGTIMAVYILKEQMSKAKSLSLIVGFAGILIITNPFGEKFKLIYFLPLVSAFCFALCGVMLRIMGRTEPPMRVASRTLLIMSALTFPLAVLYWQQPELHHLPFFILMGLMVAMVQFAVGNALQKIPLTIAHPFVFLNLIWSALFGWLFFAESLSWQTMAGATIIVLGVAINAWTVR
jgi:drug/metabolite transporter (DMT)-like permease